VSRGPAVYTGRALVERRATTTGRRGLAALLAAALAGSCTDVGKVEPGPNEPSLDAALDITNPPEAADAGSEQEAAPVSIEPNPAVLDALNAASPDCAACAISQCSKFVEGCSVVSGMGSETGTSRSQLCADTLVCLLPSPCAAKAPSACYCDDLNLLVPECLRSDPCRTELERSLESSNPTVVLSSFSDVSKGGAWALMLVQCLYENRCTSCYPSPPDDAGSDVGLDDAGDADAPTD
jgi:hypothetical protein